MLPTYEEEVAKDETLLHSESRRLRLHAPRPTIYGGNLCRSPEAPQEVREEVTGNGDDGEDDGEFVHERKGWDSKMQFLLSVIAYAVGLGNVWRFPYLCQKNGGGAFLIPYFIMLIVEGIPLCVLELGIGQRLRLGSIGVWSKIHPYLGGLGICSAIIAFLVGIYYNAIITWCFWYLFHSFSSPLPWSQCPVSATNNATIEPECAVSSPTAYFWFRKTLNISEDIGDLGGFQWEMVGCLALSWLLVFVFMSKGIQSSGKVMYVTAGFPYIVLVVFFVRAITLRGAADGLLHLFTPDMEKLKDPVVWLDAATQIFYSLGLGFGSLIAFGSYNPPNNNVTLDAIIVSLTNAFTAIFASLVIFAVLGFKATTTVENCACRVLEKHSSLINLSPAFLEKLKATPEKCMELYDVVFSTPESEFHRLLGNDTCSLSKTMSEATEGTGLAFIVFTQAIVELPAAPFWSVAFFLMLLALGMGSLFGNFAGIQTSIYDLKLVSWMSTRTLSAIMCILSFAIGLLFMTRAGIYWVELFDSFSGTFSLMLIALLEMVGVCWVFKYSKFADDLKAMTGRSLGLYWELTLKFIAPVLIVVVWLSSVIIRIMDGIAYHPYDIEQGANYEAPYPLWAKVICGLLVVVGIAPIPFVAIVRRFGISKLETSPELEKAAFNSSSSTAMMLRDASSATLDNESGQEVSSFLGATRTATFVLTDD